MGFLKGKKQFLRLRTPVIKVCLNLVKKIIFKGGRNNTGRLVLRCRGGRLLRRYRLIDFKRVFWNMNYLVLYNEYDPNRSSLISLICYYNGVLSYILATFGINTRDILYVGNNMLSVSDGNHLPLFLIPEGSMLHSIELRLGVGSKFVRSAGTFAILVKKFYNQGKVLLRLPSREEVLVNFLCMATIGRVSKIQHEVNSLFKAGQNRLRGFRPMVRGVAKNPVDHPHGGGGGRCLVTPWSKIAKNSPTKKKYRPFSGIFVVQSRKKKS